MFNQFLRFLIVGGIAAATDMVVAVVAIEVLGLFTEYELAPIIKLAVNVAGILLASVVAYAGLRRWAFASHQPHRSALPRFVAMSLGAVVIDELALLALLQLTPLSYQSALAITLIATAGLVFYVAKRWVFMAR